MFDFREMGGGGETGTTESKDRGLSSSIPSSSVPNIIFTILQIWSHALGKARP